MQRFKRKIQILTLGAEIHLRVKIRIEIFDVVRIVLLSIKFLKFKYFSEFLHILVGAVLRRLVSCETFKSHADVVHIAHIFFVDSDNARSACGLNDYMLLRETAKSLSYRRSADAEFFGKFGFGQDFSAFVFTRKDLFFELFEYLIGDRDRLMLVHHFFSPSFKPPNSLNFASSSLLDRVVDLPSSYSLSTHSFIF